MAVYYRQQTLAGEDYLPAPWVVSAGLTLLLAGSHSKNQYIFPSLTVAGTAAAIGLRTVTPTDQGLGLVSGAFGTSSDAAFGIQIGRDWTMLCIAAPKSTSATQYVLSGGGSDGNFAVGFNFDDQFGLSAGRFSVTLLKTGINRSHAYVASGATGATRAFVMRKRGNTLTAWIDGSQSTVISSGGFTSSDVGESGTPDLKVAGSSANGGVNIVDPLIMTAHFMAALPDAHCAQLSTFSGAMALFSPVPRKIWMPQAAIAVLPTLSASTYTPGSLSSGGWRPRITAT